MQNFYMFNVFYFVHEMSSNGWFQPAGLRGASVSVCADLTNQLQCCWVDPARAWKKH